MAAGMALSEHVDQVLKLNTVEPPTKDPGQTFYKGPGPYLEKMFGGARFNVGIHAFCI